MELIIRNVLSRRHRRPEFCFVFWSVLCNFRAEAEIRKYGSMPVERGSPYVGEANRIWIFESIHLPRGVVIAVEAFLLSGGPVHFQVWRPDETRRRRLTLVGYKRYNTSIISPQLVKINLAEGEYIFTEANDRFGFMYENNNGAIERSLKLPLTRFIFHIFHGRSDRPGVGTAYNFQPISLPYEYSCRIVLDTDVNKYSTVVAPTLSTQPDPINTMVTSTAKIHRLTESTTIAAPRTTRQRSTITNVATRTVMQVNTSTPPLLTTGRRSGTVIAVIPTTARHPGKATMAHTTKRLSDTTNVVVATTIRQPGGATTAVPTTLSEPNKIISAELMTTRQAYKVTNAARSTARQTDAADTTPVELISVDLSTTLPDTSNNGSLKPTIIHAESCTNGTEKDETAQPVLHVYPPAGAAVLVFAVIAGAVAFFKRKKRTRRITAREGPVLLSHKKKGDNKEAELLPRTEAYTV